MSTEIVCFGEMLWDLLPSGIMPGGAPMNVAVHLAYAGLRPSIISRVGHDNLGQELVRFLKEKDVSTAYVQTDQTQPTGVVQVHVHDAAEITYDIVSPVAWDFIQPEEEALQAVRQSRAFVFGTLAARQPTSRQTLMALLSVAPYKVVDVNFRPPHYSQEVVEELLQQAHLVKMNHHELAEVCALHQVNGGERDQMAFVLRKYNLEVMIVTRGARGAMVLQGDTFTEQAGYAVDLQDTIGSGDAFLAAFLACFLAGSRLPEALKKACLVGALVATKTGATPYISPQEIAELEKRNYSTGT